MQTIFTLPLHTFAGTATYSVPGMPEFLAITHDPHGHGIQQPTLSLLADTGLPWQQVEVHAATPNEQLPQGAFLGTALVFGQLLHYFAVGRR